MTERETMLRCGVLWGLAALLGCEAPTVVSVPFAAGDRAAIIAVDHGRLDLFAVDVARRNMMPLLQSLQGEDAAGRILVTALFYTESLEEMGLAEGPITVATADERGAAIPLSYTRMQSVGIDAAVAEAWAPLETLPDALARLRIVRRTACVSWAPGPVARGTEKYVAGVVPKNDHQAWVVAQQDEVPGAHIYVLDIDGTARMVRQIPDFTPIAMSRALDGTLLLAGESIGVVVWKGDPEGTLTPLPERPMESRLYSIRDMTDERADGLWVMDSAGNVDRLLNGSWQRMVISDLRTFGAWSSVAPITTTELLLIAPDGRAILHAQNGEVTTEHTPIDEAFRTLTNHLRTLEVFSGGTIIAGTGNGPILERRDGTWEVISDALIAERAVNDLEPFGDSILDAGGYGTVEQYVPATRSFCREDVLRLGNTLVIADVTVIQDTLLVVGFEELPSMARELRMTVAHVLR